MHKCGTGEIWIVVSGNQFWGILAEGFYGIKVHLHMD